MTVANDSTKKERLTIELRDIDGKLIAAEGSVINQTLFRDVMERGVARQGSFVSLNQPEMLKMVRKVMSEKIYRNVFKSALLQRKIFGVIKKSKIQTDLYREIFQLKKSSYFTYRHLILMGVLSTRMAMDLKKYGYQEKNMFVLALTHDIGKARLPHQTLNKKTPLTSHEYHILHSYPNFSVLLLMYYLGRHSREAIRVAYEHHEKLDGSGYPKGIKTLSKYTKIVAVADIMDALVSNRPYRKRNFTVRGALDKLISEMNERKLPKLTIQLLVSYFRKDVEPMNAVKISAQSRELEPAGSSYGKIADR